MGTCYWDDLVEGGSLECRPVILTLEEIIEFALKYDPQRFHVDPEFAARSRFQGVIASSLHTLSACTRVIVDAQKDVPILIGYGMLEVTLPNPVYPRDVLAVDARWGDLRRSKSKPEQGLATVRFRGVNQRSETVIESGFKYMIACRASESTLELHKGPHHV
ncbi:MAG: MaoC/PaaZ C-terminal domain-containing protein [Desulfuromonadaceae bacterium]|nr:MaoC/PaaZ C-terminal domain-containing protein [Desulfuromonadaceae bacterium]MDD5107788.1 MaoC/PaaZ C-terminal domain-containing protein [Desulfuromonadaceae bacterium]